jgi:hypothetical protein
MMITLIQEHDNSDLAHDPRIRTAIDTSVCDTPVGCVTNRETLSVHLGYTAPAVNMALDRWIRVGPRGN